MTEEEKKVIELAVNSQPLILLAIKDEELLKYANSFLPYSVGFEIECDLNKDNYDVSHFKSIPNIMAVDIDSTEQRFRIPPGIEGLTCLWHISETLKINSLYNPLSGIHYHIDMTRNWDLLNVDVVKRNNDWLLSQLDDWGYIGTFNKRGVTYVDKHYNEFRSTLSYPWIRFQSRFKTMEIRIGEMTFDYKDIVKRMIAASKLVREFVVRIGGTTLELDSTCRNAENVLKYSYIVKSEVNQKLQIDHLYKELKELKTEEVEEEEDMDAIIRSRIINKY